MMEKPPRNPELRRWWIMAQLRAKDSSYADIGRVTGYGRNTVLAVVSWPKGAGTYRNARIEKAIADKLGLTVEQLWPDRYPTEGKSTPAKKAAQ